jgi:alkylation response protein AidB-like acyl-CoA dehydrogenase
MGEYSFAPFLEALGDDFCADDPDLETILRHHGLDDETAWKRIRAHGKFVGRSASVAADTVDRPGALPVLMPHDPFGRPHPVGVEVHPATKRVLAAALRAGVSFSPDVWTRYATAYLQGQVGESGVTCSLACTDGLVRSLQALDGSPRTRQILDHILTQAPGGPVHGAQFVTEIQGGSDAGANTVRAVPQGDGSYRLYGNKFFCSNLWAQYWAVTARPEDAPSGPRGVALFVVPRQDDDGRNSGWRIERLKDKLGTRALPTGEITLDGAVGYPLGGLHDGLSNMVAIVLTTSRFWNIIAAAAEVRAAERIAHAYAGFRTAFGRPIHRFPLIQHTLMSLTKERKRLTAGLFEILAAWEQANDPDASADTRARSRVLIMLAKTCATKRGTTRVHDAMMILGGNGIEERFSALPRLWRDAVIMETWEGPHSLLLARSLMDLQKFGAAEDPITWTRLLLGDGARAPVVDALGDRLGAIARDADPIAQAVGFQDWAADLYDAFGDLAAERASG